MNPLEEIRKEVAKINSENRRLSQIKGELENKLTRANQGEQREPTLTFAGIKDVSNEDMDTTKAVFQNSVWLIIQHNKEWKEKVSSSGFQHPKDLIVDTEVIKAEFCDDKILRKIIEQTTEVRTSPYFRQVGPLAALLDIYMKKGYHNSALEGYVNQGQVTNENAREMHGYALEKARQEADVKIKGMAEMESQDTQDLWGQMYLSTLPSDNEETKPIIVMKWNKKSTSGSNT